MDRGVRWATVHKVTELDTTEHTLMDKKKESERE